MLRNVIKKILKIFLRPLYFYEQIHVINYNQCGLTCNTKTKPKPGSFLYLFCIRPYKKRKVFLVLALFARQKPCDDATFFFIAFFFFSVGQSTRSFSDIL